MIACITAAFTLLSLVLELLAQRKKESGINDAAANVQKIRTALSKNDAVGISITVADQHDRVRTALCGDPSGGDGARQQDAVGPTLPGQ